MTAPDPDRRLIAALAPGLPRTPRPFAEIARRAAMDEDEAIARLSRLVETGVVKRFGLVVRHRELGYRATAMVAWDVPDDRAGEAGRRLARCPGVTLAYRRARAEGWPYNLYVMVHARARAEVFAAIERAEAEAGIAGLPRAVLFTRKRYKQTGARYGAPAPTPEPEPEPEKAAARREAAQ